MTPQSPPVGDELRQTLNILFDDGRIAHANDKSPAVCQQHIDRAEAMVNAYILSEIQKAKPEKKVAKAPYNILELEKAFQNGRDKGLDDYEQALTAKFGGKK